MTFPPFADRQLPVLNEIFLDHVGHFVPAAENACAALRSAGFEPTPVSIQKNEGRLTGTGNICAMLERGYIEMLFKTADTDLGRELDASRARYEGVHLAAFAVADAAAAHGRLQDAGFRLRPVVALRRPVGTETGEAEAAFTVTRVQPNEMREGRIQILTHHTEDAVWQKRWLRHPNTARELLDLVIIVEDVEEAALRFARFLDRTPVNLPLGPAVFLDRGAVLFLSPQSLARFAPKLAVPALPFIAIYALRVVDADKAQAALDVGGAPYERRGGALTVPFPRDLGTGAWLLVQDPAELPWRRGL